MKIQEFIEKSIEGGWRETSTGYAKTRPSSFIEDGYLHEILLDPKAWEAVGKVEGWNNQVYKCESLDFIVPMWHKLMLNMIDHLAEGGTIESYLETL